MNDATGRWPRTHNLWPAYAPDEILPNLWQGGTEDNHVIGNEAPSDYYEFRSQFDLVITLYADSQPAPWGVEELRFGFFDAGLTPELTCKAIEIASYAYNQWCGGARVLIRCQAGINRSGLISALVLVLHGRTAEAAIAMLRARRSPMVLCNADFQRWLLTDADVALQQRLAS